MTHEEAGRIIGIFVKAYPTQARDEEFLSLMAIALETTRLHYWTVRERAWSWVKAERFWPAISDMIDPAAEDLYRPVALIAPANPIPTEQGLEILRRTMR